MGDICRNPIVCKREKYMSNQTTYVTATAKTDILHHKIYHLKTRLTIMTLIKTSVFRTASGMKINWKRTSFPDSGIAQYSGRMRMPLANATRAREIHVTFLHHTASLHSADNRSEARQTHWIFEEFSLSEIRTKPLTQGIDHYMLSSEERFSQTLHFVYHETSP